MIQYITMNSNNKLLNNLNIHNLHQHIKIIIITIDILQELDMISKLNIRNNIYKYLIINLIQQVHQFNINFKD
jgi:hypothetical protein